MTLALSQVSFHTGVAEPVSHMLKVIRKALAQELRVCTVGPAEEMAQLDELLWTFDGGSFLPHVRVPQAAARSVVRRSRVVLVDEDHALSSGLPSQGDLLINLGAELPVEGLGFARIVELVRADPQSRSAGQGRWRKYRESGLNPSHHAVGASAS